jgi:nicotinamide-nucleotide adenylyltransferase
MVIQGMTKLCKKVVIGIGSSDKAHTAENPFTVGERKEMIQQALQDEDIIPMFDIEFVELPDHENDAQWTQQVLDKVGHVDMVWTGNEQTKKCFEGKLEIKEIKEVPGISSTAIREMIKKGNADWKTKVPGAIVYAIQELGPSRIK